MARSQPCAAGDIALAGGGRAAGNGTLATCDPFAAGQLLNRHLVQLRDGRKVEAGQALDGRELRSPDTAPDLPPFPADPFQFDRRIRQPGTEVEVQSWRKTLLPAQQGFGIAFERMVATIPDQVIHQKSAEQGCPFARRVRQDLCHQAPVAMVKYRPRNCAEEREGI